MLVVQNECKYGGCAEMYAMSNERLKCLVS